MKPTGGARGAEVVSLDSGDPLKRSSPVRFSVGVRILTAGSGWGNARGLRVEAMIEQLIDQRRRSIGSFEVGRSEEHTSELQSRGHLVCRLLLEKKKQR